jgi:riboflavin kinase
MDEILIFLFKKKAHAQPLSVTTSELGEVMGFSQQNASRRLGALEQEGYIEKTQAGIMLTKKAYSEIASLYGGLRSVFEEGELEIEGKVVKGLGEGRYYLSLDGYRKQIKELLGFEPYPGTLNIDVMDSWDREQLVHLDPVVIKGFKGKDRSYGDLFAYRCRLEGHECALIVPLRTHHGPKTLELACSFNIRKKLGKKDGDKVKVAVW